MSPCLSVGLWLWLNNRKRALQPANSSSNLCSIYRTSGKPPLCGHPILEHPFFYFFPFFRPATSGSTGRKAANRLSNRFGITH